MSADRAAASGNVVNPPDMPAGPRPAAAQHDPADVNAERTTFSVVEERVAVQIEEQETSTVRVRTVTRKELTEIPIILRSSTVQVERIPVHRFVDAPFAPRQEGDTLVVPIFEYVPVTEMKLVLKEEVRITTIITEKTDVHLAELQHRDVVIERRVGATGEWIAQTTDDAERNRR